MSKNLSEETEETEEEEEEVETEAEEVNDHDDQVVDDVKTGEKLHIPGDVVTTEFKDTNGEPIPDRILTILHNEYVNYPVELPDGSRKVGDIKVNQDLNNKMANGQVDPAVADLVLEIQEYVKEGDGNETTKQKIRKTIPKKYYPTVQKLREMAVKATVPPQ